MINVLLVDDHELVRTAIRKYLEEVKNIKVVGEVASGEEALAWARKNEVDVVLMDMIMPGLNGLDTTGKFLKIRPDARILVLSAQTEDPFPTKVMQAGAFGYLSKNASLEEMVTAINTVFKGRKYLSQEIAQQMALNTVSATDKENPFNSLSERELQITLLITKGSKVNDIAEKLSLSPKTVNSYRYRIFEKLSINGDVELTRLAIRYKLVDE